METKKIVFSSDHHVATTPVSSLGLTADQTAAFEQALTIIAANQDVYGKTNDVVMAANKKVILDVLRSLGVTSATVTYEGSGDSGGVESIEYQPDIDVKVTNVKAALLSIQRFYSRPKIEVAVIQGDVDFILSTFCDDVIAACGYAGYENNEGGGGTLTLDVQGETVQLEQYSVEYVRETSHHVL